VSGKAMAVMDDVSGEGFVLMIADLTKTEESLQQAGMQGGGAGSCPALG